MYYYYYTVPTLGCPFPLLAGGREKKENRFRGKWWQGHANKSFHTQGGTERTFRIVQQGLTCLPSILHLPCSYTHTLYSILSKPAFGTYMYTVQLCLSLIIFFSVTIFDPLPQNAFAWLCYIHALFCVLDLTEEFQLDQPVIQGRGKYFNDNFFVSNS